MDDGAEFAQYQQDPRAPQPQMYSRYAPASSYPPMPSYYEQPRGYPTGPAEPRAYDPTQPQHSAYGPPTQDPIYMGYGKEPLDAPKPAVSAPAPAQYNYSKDYQPIYTGFFSDQPASYASKIETHINPLAGGAEAVDGGQPMGEKKAEPFSAFSQPLGLGFFPPPKSDEGDSSDTKRIVLRFHTVAYGGAASYKPY
ncbi:MAG: hypothetical protein P4L10_09215 [Acidobacteriaceae bacterium]|nr:hypothetical protein [Acidobacteriaceae bacterium]